MHYRERTKTSFDRKLQQELDVTLSQIETFWYQKSRAELIHHGDHNTRFFHTSNIIKRIINQIKVDHMMAGWKTKCLSLVGRTMPIQVTVTAIPAYTMQTVRIPRSVCNDIDRKMKRFLWGRTSMERRSQLVAWEVVIEAKDDGGLRLRSMRQLNATFLMKLESSTLCGRVLIGKYCRGGHIESHIATQNSSNVWCNILETHKLMKKGMGHIVGDGKELLSQAIREVPED
ncbi:LOW QUALITY PROTEIN: hypothetical protein Cgig2_022200 [Carnegiea gigantea]|uniref:Uncharacterized protein n=1 Tax=Carnegiea gigantea TaxID=171969 RepID=A0A9Q1GN12_9CARY|nr:LOW QUALITY PROTEIN: hypothetical protein Cgig2_022200 [Carnegiea gigantea]